MAFPWCCDPRFDHPYHPPALVRAPSASAHAVHGAYGDEGALELLLCETYASHLKGGLMEAWLNQDLRMLERSFLIEVASAFELAVTQWTPLRFRIPGKDLERIMAQVTARVEASSLDPSDLLLLHTMVRLAVEERSILEVVRGERTWRMLRDLDLFCMQGAFQVEREVMPVTHGEHPPWG